MFDHPVMQMYIKFLCMPSVEYNDLKLDLATLNLIGDVLICSFVAQNGSSFHVPTLSHKHKRCLIVYLLRIQYVGMCL